MVVFHGAALTLLPGLTMDGIPHYKLVLVVILGPCWFHWDVCKKEMFVSNHFLCFSTTTLRSSERSSSLVVSSFSS